jgi:predicted AlkP superfamily pyrophosphatase or phosphodiesterase
MRHAPRWQAAARGCVLRALCLLPLGVTAAERRQVIVVSLDGISAAKVDAFLASGVLPPGGALAQMARSGVRAAGLVPLNVSVTVPAHVAMYTGALPAKTGIPAAGYVSAGRPVTEGTNALRAPIGAETLWQAAMRQGKTVGCVRVMGADGASPERSCTWTVNRPGGDSWNPAFTLVPDESPGVADRWSLGPLRAEHFCPLRSAGAAFAFSVGPDELVPLYAAAVDTTFDGVERYDAVVLSTSERLEQGRWVRLGPDDALPLLVRKEPRQIGSTLRLASFRSDLREVVLAPAPWSVLLGGPPAFLDEVERRVGFWPGESDAGGSEAAYWDQEERFNRWYLDVSLLLLQQHRPDLLITYFPVGDDAGHDWTLEDPRQPDYDAERGNRRLRFARYIERAYQLADQLVGELRAAAPDADLLVISDHGMTPLHSQVALYALLRAAGIRASDDKDSELVAVVNGPSAHLYINTQGERPGGVVSPSRKAELVQRALRACRSLRDPRTGEPIFQEAVSAAELPRLGLDSRNSGDAWVSARPGYILDTDVLSGDFVRPTGAMRGVHGNLGSEVSMHAILFASGPHVPRQLLGLVPSTAVAPTVAGLLGVAPPAEARSPAAFTPASPPVTTTPTSR